MTETCFLTLLISNKNINNPERQHRAELLLRHASGHELLLSDLSVGIDVHFLEGQIGQHLLTGLFWIVLLAQQVEKVFDDAFQFFHADCAVVVDVEDAEYLILNYRIIRRLKTNAISMD